MNEEIGPSDELVADLLRCLRSPEAKTGSVAHHLDNIIEAHKEVPFIDVTITREPIRPWPFTFKTPGETDKEAVFTQRWDGSNLNWQPDNGVVVNYRAQETEILISGCVVGKIERVSFAFSKLDTESFTDFQVVT